MEPCIIKILGKASKVNRLWQNCHVWSDLHSNEPSDKFYKSKIQAQNIDRKFLQVDFTVSFLTKLSKVRLCLYDAVFKRK